MGSDEQNDTRTSPQHWAGQQIRAARLRKGWNQLVLADKAGVSRTTLYQLERGAIPAPRFATLYRLATALEIPVTWLTPEALSETAVDVSDQTEARQAAAELDRQTNPYVDAVRSQYPQVFAGFTPVDWDELISAFGTGGPLTEAGVLQAALVISQKRETLRRVSVLLETHLAEPTTAMVNSLFDLIQVVVPPTAPVD